MIGSIREYFFLSDARATAKLVPEHARTALHDKLARGRQRSEAADALWSNGHGAEGLRLASQAFEATLEGRELTIFRDRWRTDPPKTLQEIGDHYGVSRERARQLEKRVLDRLRKYLRAELGTDVDIDISRD